jgi:hypothetical protein
MRRTVCFDHVEDFNAEDLVDPGVENVEVRVVWAEARGCDVGLKRVGHPVLAVLATTWARSKIVRRR